MVLDQSNLDDNSFAFLPKCKYFDISINRWNLDKLVPSVLEAHKRCKEIKNTNL